MLSDPVIPTSPASHTGPSAVSGVSPGFIAVQVAPSTPTIGLLTTGSFWTFCATAEKLRTAKQSKAALKPTYFFILAIPLLRSRVTSRVELQQQTPQSWTKTASDR